MFNLDDVKAGSPWGAATYAVRAEAAGRARVRAFTSAAACVSSPLAVGQLSNGKQQLQPRRVLPGAGLQLVNGTCQSC